MIASEYSKRLLGWVGRVILKIREALPPSKSDPPSCYRAFCKRTFH